jgi:hypothetical protein
MGAPRGKHEWIPLDFGYFRTCLMDASTRFFTEAGLSWASSRQPDTEFQRDLEQLDYLLNKFPAFRKDPDARG